MRPADFVKRQAWPELAGPSQWRLRFIYTPKPGQRTGLQDARQVEARIAFLCEAGLRKRLREALAAEHMNSHRPTPEMARS